MVDFDGLFEKLNKEVKEETTSSDIAYAPAMGFYGTYKDKKRIEKDKEKVKKEQDKVQSPLFPETIEEKDIQAEIKRLKKKIVKEVEGIIAKSKLNFKDVNRLLKAVPMRFPGALIQGVGYGEDLLKLYEKLPQDIGELEMILASLENKLSLYTVTLFSEYRYLFGVRLGSRVNGIEVVYDGYIDMGYNEQEMLYIKDKKVLEEIDSRFTAIAIEGNVVYPLGGVFRKDVLEGIVEIIKEV